MTNIVDPDQTAPIGAVCSGSTLFAYILNLSVILCNYLQQTTSADDIFRCIFFLALLGLIKNLLNVWPKFKLISHKCSSYELYKNWRNGSLLPTKQLYLGCILLNTLLRPFLCFTTNRFAHKFKVLTNLITYFVIY